MEWVLYNCPSFHGEILDWLEFPWFDFIWWGNTAECHHLDVIVDDVALSNNRVCTVHTQIHSLVFVFCLWTLALLRHTLFSDTPKSIIHCLDAYVWWLHQSLKLVCWTTIRDWFSWVAVNSHEILKWSLSLKSPERTIFGGITIINHPFIFGYLGYHGFFPACVILMV